MYPDQQNQNGGQPGYGTTPTPQQNNQGQYEIVPPLPSGQNNGHTGHNPYEFIVNPEKTARPAGLFGSGNALLMRIAIIGGGLVVIMVIVAVLVSALTPKGPTAGLTAVGQRQQEIIRIATDAGTKAVGQDTKDFVVTTALTVTSSQQQTIAYLTSRGVKLDPKTLALDADATTDSTLANALSAGTYDSAVVQNLTEQLQTYESLLQSTFKQTNSQAAKQVLQNDFSTADKLLNQAKNLSSTTFGS